MPRHLVYTLALDPAGAMEHRNMAKLLVSSLLRSGFTGDIVVFHNSPHPLLHGAARLACGRFEDRGGQCAGLRPLLSVLRPVLQALAGEAHRSQIGYDKIAFIDCDAVVIKPHRSSPLRRLGSRRASRSLDAHPVWLLWLLSHPEHERETLQMEGVNSGTWAVRASRWRELMKTWRSHRVKARALPRGQLPFRAVRLQSPRARLEPHWVRGEVAHA
jgi:hypothetical protein